MKRVFSIAISCAAMICVSQQDAKSKTDRVKATVFVKVVDGSTKEEKQLGSGFLLGQSGLLITAKHVIEEAYIEKNKDQILVSLKGKEQQAIEARVWDCGKGHIDICVLYINSDAVKQADIKDTFDLSCRLPIPNETITAVGYPYGKFSPLSEMTGTVAGSGMGENFKFYMTAAVVPGMSGGPVLDQQDKVIGVIHGADSVAKVLSFFQGLLHGRSLFENFGAAEIKCDAGIPSPSAAPIGPPVSQKTSELSPENAKRVRAYIQIAREDQRANANKASAALRGIGVFAPGIENVGSRAPNNAEVRYFNDEDESTAESVRSVIKGTTGLEFKTNRHSGSSKAPLGSIEIWFDK
ncbi:hypothetical protein AU375_03340 [Methylobacterium radiotolerans]|nr:hypothetical protein AU375_03340 [Methylobacterium radiotolerans]